METVTRYVDEGEPVLGSRQRVVVRIGGEGLILNHQFVPHDYPEWGWQYDHDSGARISLAALAEVFPDIERAVRAYRVAEKTKETRCSCQRRLTTCHNRSKM